MFGETLLAPLAADGQRPKLIRVIWVVALVFLSPPVSAQQTANDFHHRLFACSLADLDQAETLLKPLPSVSYARGRIEHALGQFERAIAAYNRSTEIEPGHMPASRCREAARKGLQCAVTINPSLLIGVWDTAPSKLSVFSEHWKQWLRNRVKIVYPEVNRENSIEFAWLVGRRYFATGELDKALFLFNEELRIHPDSLLLLLGRAHVWAAGNRQREAITDFTKIIDLTLQEAHEIMARLAPYRSRELTPAVKDELDRLYWPSVPFSSFSMLVDLLEARALAHHKRGDLIQALADYQRVLQIVPGHTVVSFMRDRLVARIRRESGRRADDVIRRTLESVDSSGNPFAGFASFYPRFAGRYSDMSDGRHRYLLLLRYLDRGLYEVATTYLVQWARTTDRWQDVNLLLRSLYTAMGEHEHALKLYDAFLADHPDSSPYHPERAAVYAALGQFDLAIADLTVYLKDDIPENYEIRHQRARAYAATGAYDRAIEDMRSIEPAFLSTYAIYNFDMARFHAMKGDYLLAARWATKAIELTPEFARAYELRALAYFFQATVQPPPRALKHRQNSCTPPQE